MCWRDNVVQSRWCSFCGSTYYGDLGHRNCAKLTKRPVPEPGYDMRRFHPEVALRVEDRR